MPSLPSRAGCGLGLLLPQLALCWAGWRAFLSLVPPSPANELVLVDRGSDVAIVFGQRRLGDKDRENDCWCSLAFGDCGTQLVRENLLGPQKNLTKLGGISLKISTLKAACSTHIS